MIGLAQEVRQMKILLACNAGMSTSMLVQRMNQAAQARNIEATIMAVPISQAMSIYPEWDIVLLGPQVRHQLKAFVAKSGGVTPIGVIDMRDYGTMNGENVLNTAIDMMNKGND